MSVSYSASSVTVSDGATSAVFTVKRSGTSSELSSATSVDYETGDVTATSGTDYTATSGSLDFAADVTEATITVTIDSEAYTSSATKTFLLTLTGYGSATGSITPSTTSSTTQTYLYLPEDDDSVTVPTADSPGDNLKHQALYSGFSAPDNTSVEMPLAYLRLGYAGSDMNDYERVILNSDNYHPAWAGTEDNGSPKEPGTMQHMMLPRSIDRRSETVSDKESGNAHLNGMLLYSNANYSLTVGGHATQVIQGDLVTHVEGSGRINYMDKLAQWVYDKGERSFLTANGVTRINGIVAEYDIGWLKKFTAYANWQINYNFDVKYEVNADVSMTISNAAQYEVSNSLSLKVTGYQVAAECDVYGNYSCKYFPGEIASTQTMVDTTASGSICMSIQTGVSTAWTAAVAVAANANALAAASLSIGAAASTFKSDSEFFKMATPDNLDTDYADAFTTILPDTCAGLGAITATIVALACISQKIADVAPGIMPKIEMNAEGMTLSCGDDSEIIVNETGVYINAPVLYAVASEVTIDSLAGIALTAATALEVTAPEANYTGELTADGEIFSFSDITSAGVVYGNLVDSG